MLPRHRTVGWFGIILLLHVFHVDVLFGMS